MANYALRVLAVWCECGKWEIRRDGSAPARCPQCFAPLNVQHVEGVERARAFLRTRTRHCRTWTERERAIVALACWRKRPDWKSVARQLGRTERATRVQAVRLRKRGAHLALVHRLGAA